MLDYKTHFLAIFDSMVIINAKKVSTSYSS